MSRKFIDNCPKRTVLSLSVRGMYKMKRRMLFVILLSFLMIQPALSQENVVRTPGVLEMADVSRLTEVHGLAEVTGAVEIPETLTACRGAFFSSEEDFVTLGPEPADGNPIISDGDLLGPGCVVFARNRELLAVFKSEQDLGLDAADVIDAGRRLVAFSTELDDPLGRFTAGDLLVTNGAVIPNRALLANFEIETRGDLGLDAVHFVGDLNNIIRFLDYAPEVSREGWLDNPGMLPQMLEEYGIDIWFSTEGTAPEVEMPLFIDGDLLSAQGGIVAKNSLLLSSAVPAGIPNRGVDFGLDAVTADRSGNRQLIHFSTEILYRGEPAFSDGDVLLLGDGVVCTNEDITHCFEPKTKELGLDALSLALGRGERPPCGAAIIRVGGMPTGNINSQGLANGWSATTPPFEAFDSPFGGWVEILGLMPSCEECERFKVEYGEWSSPTTPPDPDGFKPMTDSFKEWTFVWPSLWVRVDRVPDSEGWLGIICDSDPVMGGLYYPWNTGGKNGKYSLRLTVESVGGVEHVSSPVVVVIDNTPPTAILNLSGTPSCGDITIGDKVTGEITATDEHFYSYQLSYRCGLHPACPGSILPVRKYAGVSDQGDAGLTFTWDTSGLPPCGYEIMLEVWDRTIVNNGRGWGEPGYAHRSIDYDFFCLEAAE
ncbi:MAG: hypothetical protein NUK54_05740 [Methanothrix sp.]|nr:hypothetical protein [Methanothrix sp.]